MKTRKIVVSIVAVIALIALLSVCLVACNYENYASKLEKEGYIVLGGEKDNAEEGIEWALNATRVRTLDNVTVIKYVSMDDAKEAEATLGEDNITRIGSIIIFGTEQGVKDAK